MLARLDAPVYGAIHTPYSGKDRWMAQLGWRYQESDRHFRGSVEEANRQAEHSEVINTINILDLTFAYTINERWRVGASFPFLIADRSSPIRDDNGVTFDRSSVGARGLGDIVLGARRWMFDSATHPNGNLQFGFGLKIPTGRKDVLDTRTRYANGVYVDTVETVDQSIQPGDGGLGVVLDMQSFMRFAHDRCAGYFSATYLFNPEGTSGVYTYRSRASEAYMSIADQYLARAGVSFALPRRTGASLSLGGRIEGVPAKDIFGASDGFRRPGYAVSVEPGFTMVHGLQQFSVSVPVALYRNRVASVPDMESGRLGDAAFADWFLLVGYSVRFGGEPSAVAGAGDAPACEAPGPS